LSTQRAASNDANPQAAPLTHPKDAAGIAGNGPPSQKVGAPATGVATPTTKTRQRGSRATDASRQKQAPGGEVVEFDAAHVDAPTSAMREASDALCQAYLEERRQRYGWQGAKDGAALAWLLRQAEADEVVRRWRRGLRATGWASCSTVAQLRARWNDLTTPRAGEVAGGSRLADEVFGVPR
jgi:hypothetical protein